jgi:uncharacterized protein (TIGR04255 family)
MDAAMGMLQNDGAPIVQLLVTVSFNPLPDFSLLDLADVARLFQGTLPVFQLVNRVGPMPAVPSPDEVSPFIANAIPRFALTTSDARDQLIFQEDRLSFGWSRTTPLGSEHDYPGFTSTLDQLRSHLQTLERWVTERGIALHPLVGEIVYTDAFLPAADVPLSAIFTPLNPASARQVNSLQYSWQSDWPGSLSGQLFGTIAGPALSRAGEVVMSLETTGRFALEDGWASWDSAFAEAHQVMRATFESLVNPAARSNSV